MATKKSGTTKMDTTALSSSPIVPVMVGRRCCFLDGVKKRLHNDNVAVLLLLLWSWAEPRTKSRHVKDRGTIVCAISYKFPLDNPTNRRGSPPPPLPRWNNQSIHTTVTRHGSCPSGDNGSSGTLSSSSSSSNHTCACGGMLRIWWERSVVIIIIMVSSVGW